MCGNLLLSRASPPSSHLRGTIFGSAVARGLSPLTLPLPSGFRLDAGMTWVWGPYGLGIPSGLLWFRRSQQLPLRIRALQLQRSFITGWWQRCAHLPSSAGRRLSVACGGTPPEGRVLATLCYAARCRTSFNCSCYVLKGCADPSRRGDSSKRSGRPSPRGAPSYCYTTYVVRMSNEL